MTGAAEVRRYLGGRPEPGRTLVGILQSNPLDQNVARLALTDHRGRVVTGDLLLPVDAIESVRLTSRSVWSGGAVHEEVAVTLDEKAQVPVEMMIRFIKGLLEQSSRLRAMPPVETVVAGGGEPQPTWHGAECYYEGCGSPDGWPRV